MKSGSGNFATVFLTVALPLGALIAADARAGDFVFGEDFEGNPACAVTSGFAVLATPASRASTLGLQSRYLVKIRSCGDAAANALAASGGPATWTKVIDPPNLTLASNASGVALLTVSVPSDGDAGMATFDITAQAGANTVHASADLNVANEYILTIADGTGSGDHHFPAFLQLKLGAKLRTLDADSVLPHRIHGDGAGGFLHQAGEMTQGQEFDITTTAVGGPYDFYCHDHGTGSGDMHVTVVP
jgi:plastocyanin